MNQEIKTSGPSIGGSEEDDWETAEFPTVAQPKTALAQPSSSSSAATADALALAANLRPSAPTFQPRTTKPPAPRLWQPEPPVAPASNSTTAGGASGKLGIGAGGGVGSNAAAGTGRSVLLGPVVDAREGTSQPAGVLDRGRSSSTGVGAASKSASSDDRDRTRNADLSSSITAHLPGSSTSTPISTPALSKPTILKRVTPAAKSTVTTAASSPFGDDEEWSRDPRTTVVSNSELWEQANNSAPMPALPKNAPPMPTAASLRILRRPSPATSASSSSYRNIRQHNNNEPNQQSSEQSDRDGSENGAPENAGSAGMGRMNRGSPNGASGSRSGSRRNKTLVEREEEYKRARERIFGTTAGLEGEGSPGPADLAVGDNRSEVSGGVGGSGGLGGGYDSGSVTPARSGSSSTGSIVSGSTNAGGGAGTNNVTGGNGPVAATSTPGQQSRSGSVGPGGNLPLSSSSSSIKSRTGPTQSNKRRGESHFEPLRPPGSSMGGGGGNLQGGTVGGGQYSPAAAMAGGVSGYGRGSTTPRDRVGANGGHGGPGLYQGYDTMPYGGGLANGMPYQGSLQQQQQGYGAGAGTGVQPGGYTNYSSQFTGYPGAQAHPQVQPQLGVPGGYGRMPSSGNGGGNGYGSGPMRQPIGPGDVDGMGMGFGQLRMSDSSPYGAPGPGGMQDVGSGGGWNGPPRPAYSSSSSSASSDVGSTGGGPGAGGYLFAGNGGYVQDKSYRSSGPVPNHQPYAYPTMQSHHLGYSQHSQSGVEQPQPGYLGGRVGPSQYGQPWQNIRKGSGENGGGDSGYTR